MSKSSMSKKDKIAVWISLIGAVILIGFVVYTASGLPNDHDLINKELNDGNISCSHLKAVRNLISHNPLDYDLLSKIDDTLTRGNCK